jgi:hypothetical protein
VGKSTYAVFVLGCLGLAATSLTAGAAPLALSAGPAALSTAEYVAVSDRGVGTRGSRPPGMQHQPGSSRSAPAPSYRGSPNAYRGSRTGSSKEERAYRPPANLDRRNDRGRSAGSAASCDWLYRRAIRDDDRYWWNRYRSCVSAY